MLTDLAVWTEDDNSEHVKGNDNSCLNEEQCVARITTLFTIGLPF